MVQTSYSKKWLQLFAIACLVGIVPLLYSFGELYFADNYFYFCRLGDSVDSGLYHFDPNWAFGPYYANSMAVASGMTGAIAWNCLDLGFRLRSVAVAFGAFGGIAWLISNSHVNVGYVLALLATQTLSMTVLPLMIRKPRHRPELSGQYTILDVTSLTFIIALSLVVLKPMYSALCNGDPQIGWFRPSPIYWVLLLGISLGLVSSIVPFITTRRPYVFVVAIAFAYASALLVVVAFKQFAILRKLDCNYMPESFVDMERGYLHWFLLHGVVQFGMLIAWALFLSCVRRRRGTMACTEVADGAIL